jgi:hypothetical protein
MKKAAFLILILAAIGSAVNAQDKIYRSNGKIIEAKVIEVGSSEVKYREFKDLEGPTYVLETDRIKKIVYENGKVETFADSFKDPERYAGQRNKAIKMNFFSPLYGYFEAAYEKNVSYGKGYELSLGIIGAGKSGRLDYFSSQLAEVKRKPFGFFVSGGYKFSKLPDFIIFGKSRATHLMQGTYAKPIIYIGHYKENIIVEKANNLFEVGKQNVTFGAIQIEIGRQWVLGENLVLDIYQGLGYGFDNKKDSRQYLNSAGQDYYQDVAAFNYANFRLGKSPSLSYTVGLKLGWLLK